GFVNSESLEISGVEGMPALYTSADQDSPAGGYDILISAGSLTAKNYEFSFTKGMLVIGKGLITVTAENKRKTYGDPNPTLTYTYNGFVNGETLATSGITGTPVISTEVNQQTGAGEYDIVLSQGTLNAGNYVIQFIKGKFTVDKALVTVIAQDKSRLYGQTNPEFTVMYNGFVNNESLASSGILGMPELGTPANATSPAGEYLIKAGNGTLLSNNYNFTFIDAKLTIGKAALKLTVDNKTKTYGDPNPEFTVTYNGFANGEVFSSGSVIGSLNFITDANTNSAAGQYEIRLDPASLFSDKYELSFASGQLTIAKAMLSIRAENKSRTYGVSNPPLTFTYNGFVNGENLSSSGVTGLPMLSTSANQLSGAGTYDIAITKGTLAATNYDFQVAKGTLTIDRATLTVSAITQTRKYGTANSTINWSLNYNGFANGENLQTSDVIGTPAFTTDATTSTSVGTYPVLLSKGTLTSGNYQFNFVNTELIIEKALVTISADNKSKLYGTPNPEFTYSYSGFMNGEILASSDVKGKPGYVTSATDNSPAGNYEIEPTLGNLNSGNYEFAFTKGWLTIGKATLTITVENKTRKYGTANPNFTVTYNGFVGGENLLSSGIIGAPALNTAATILSPVGSYDIKASAGSLNSDNYLFNFVHGKLTINKAQLAVTAENKVRPYGTANPVLTVTYNGFVNNEDFAGSGITGLPDISTAAGVTSPAGTYDITVGAGSLASSNYELVYTKGTLTIGKVVLTVNVENKSRTYGSQNPVFTVNYNGFANGETLATSGISGKPALSTMATPSSPVGSYDISGSVGTLSAANYSFQFNKGTLSIGKALLVVTADDKAKSYGAEMPVLTASFSGFVNGETLTNSGVAGLPVLTTTATATSELGTYPIGISSGNLSADNYLFSFVGGKLVIGKAIINVMAENKTREYGDPNPSLTYTLNGFTNGETLATSGVSGLPVLSTYADAKTPAGDHDIVVSMGSLSSSKYEFNLVKAKLSITKATVIVTAENKMRYYGEKDPEFTANYIGFKNGEILSSSDITGKPSLTTSAVATSPVGNYDIEAATGNLSSTNYKFIFNKGTLVVGKATLVVSANNLTRPFGAANPELTVTFNGLANGETYATSGMTGWPVLSTSATATSELGTYDISIEPGNLASSNYALTFQKGVLTINKAILTVKAENKSKPYSSPNPELTFTYNGFVLGETLATSGVTGMPTISTEAETLSSAGDYDIVVGLGTLAAQHYQIDLVKGTLSITKIPLTITAESKSKVYGTANPKFTATYSGFVNGESLLTSGINGFPSYTTVANTNTGAGTYDIVISKGSLISANYAFNFVNGSLSINKAQLTITANNKSKIYGSSNPVLTSTITGFVLGETLATSGVTGTAALNTPATASSPVGNYDIQPSLGTLVSANYAFNYVKGTLMVGKATLTISADNKTKLY
ncbi:MAG: MBG domain-containing protein, partial [Chitinophagaceae bacterium]